MTLLLDSGPLAWAIDTQAVDVAPSAAAQARMASEDRLIVSSVSLFEIGIKVWNGKWPEMREHLPGISALCDRIGIERASLDDATALRAAALDWPHRDPFDRLIVATALSLDCPVVSTDRRFADVAPELVR